MIYLYRIFKLRLQASSSRWAGSQGQGRSGGCEISNIHWRSFLGSQECWVSWEECELKKEGWFSRQEIQSQHADATRRVALCGELGTRRDVSEKRPPILVGRPLAGKEHRSCHPKGLHFSAEERMRAKTQVFKGGCCKLDPTVYLRKTVANGIGRKLMPNGSHLLQYRLEGTNKKY